jgi:hypothetical protein
MRGRLGLGAAWLLVGTSCSTDAGVEQSIPDSPPPAHQIGTGDGSASSVTFTVVYVTEQARQPTDLAFHPSRDELWVVLRESGYTETACTETDHTGCDPLWGSTAIIRAAGGEQPEAEWKQDQNAWHFMRRPTSIAMGASDTFATCHEARTGNHTDSDDPFIGPTLWSSDPAIYAVEPSAGGNGSHLDMLHSTPFCMGIAHERDNAYWTFNGDLGALDRYDFKQPHEPGGEDHRDGEVTRWAEGQLLRVPDVPSHLAYDSRDASLYVADTGHGRVVRLDTRSGNAGEPFPNFDGAQVSYRIDGATLQEVVPPGVLQAPSGLALAGDVLFVTDRATGVIHAFDVDGRHLRQLDTARAGGLAGLVIGPDDRAYFVDYSAGEVVRIDAAP